MSTLTDFKLLSFDVYGTLIDHERGMLASFKPMLEKSNKTNLDPKEILQVVHVHTSAQQTETPSMRYSELLATIHPKVCAELTLEEPTQEESKAFGASIKTWPAFPDSVSALHRLHKTYKMVVLSNVDNDSFAANNASSLEGFPWDLILTAEDIGSYKPNHKNFEYMLRTVKEKFGIEKHEVLQTAQSQYHDHHPAKELGIASSWIYRPDAAKGDRDDPVYSWKFDTLAEMADAVDKELAGGK